MKKIDLAGQQYASLTVLEPDGSGWLCGCVCGELVKTSTKSLRAGKIRSCGCQRIKLLVERNTKHGLASERAGEYRCWKHMRERCRNPNDKSFANYGGRGITVDSAWDDFEVFLRDMGPRPPGMSVERIDNEGHYTASNCRWATRAEQNSNTRRSKKIEIDGVVKTATQWADEMGVRRGKVLARLRAGWPVEALFSQ